jgi:LysM repeat protein
VRGGWPALYAANRDVIGPDPDIIQPGTVLALPARQAPARYTVAAGDTLSGIAAALAVPGGWPALYAANRRAIGPDPDLIRPGTVLTIPPAPAATRPPAPAPHPAQPARPAHPAAPAPGGRPHSAPARTGARAPAGMPRWLLTMLVAVGVLIAAAFIAELVLVIARRRRQATARDALPGTACLTQAAAPGSPSGDEACIVVADYDRLVVTHSRADDKVYVLRPPGEDPRAILRVARLVLAEDPYEKLANRLGVPASWPMD